MATNECLMSAKSTVVFLQFVPFMIIEFVICSALSVFKGRDIEENWP